MASILNETLARRAFAKIRPALELMMRQAMPDRAGCAIVVAATPAIDPAPGKDAAHFRERCHLVTSIGDLSRSPYPNMEIALKKAEMSARTGLPTAALAAHHLLAGDTVYSGSAVLEGIVVACAGLEPRDDEMFSHWIAAAVKAEASRALAGYLADKSDADFLD